MARIEQKYSDPYVKKALDWFLSFLSASEWQKRKESIEANIDSVFEPKKSERDMLTPEPVSIADDRIGWYLYLAETSIVEIHKYEPMQGSRVLPVFHQMGKYFDQLLRLNGIGGKVKLLLRKKKNQADSELFEMLTALLWIRNGYDEVEFIKEAPPNKRPDIKASSGEEDWYIECKRLAKSSGYSLREREKWLRIWRYLANFLTKERLPFVFDIRFHVELESLPDDFLQKELTGKIKFISPPCTMISNEVWDVSVTVVDFDKVNFHLEKFYVKQPSDQLAELVAGRRDPNRGFTYLVYGKMGRIGKGVTGVITGVRSLILEFSITHHFRHVTVRRLFYTPTLLANEPLFNSA